LRSVDEAIRRRFHFIPFAVTISPEKRDGELTEKLKAEWPGILKWLIEGCLEWQREGLKPPAAVIDATTTYLEAEDAFGAWVDDRCERDPSGWETIAALFASWSSWATVAGENAGTERKFGNTLESKGFSRGKRNHARGHSGLLIVPQEGPEPYWRRD
jgi:putative DNA primase/helicase